GVLDLLVLGRREPCRDARGRRERAEPGAAQNMHGGELDERHYVLQFPISGLRLNCLITAWVMGSACWALPSTVPVSAMGTGLYCIWFAGVFGSFAHTQASYSPSL